MPTLDWIGKQAVVRHHAEVPFRLLEEVPELSCPPADGSDTENLIVQGDNLEALKALLPRYAGQVKCIYIDPPYNTGNEGWVYNDAVNSPEIRQWLGKVVGKEAEDLSRHDKWLCMMYPRLVLLRQFLREDGAIFISIDDNEVSSLRLLMDEVFGKVNFVVQIEWQKRYTRSNNTAGFTTMLEHIVVYQKSGAFSPNLEKKGEEADARYRNPDNDPRGPWKAIPFSNPVAPDKRPNLCYDIVQPNTGKILKNTRKAWRSSREVYEQYVAEKRVWWGADGKSDSPNIKRFLAEVRRGMPPVNFWSYDFAGHTDDANAEIKELFADKVFDTPKPSLLIQRVIEHATNPGELILDSFAGSGTTGHAVLGLNKQDGSNRRFILCEIDEKIAGDITAERVRRVAKGYTNAKGEAVGGLGGGFQFVRLGKTLFDETGAIRADVKFAELAEFVFFRETGRPLPKLARGAKRTALLGTHEGRAVYLLFNGILGDRSVAGGNVLTAPILAELPPHDGPRVIYAAACRLGRARLDSAQITFKQTPYDLPIA